MNLIFKFLGNIITHWVDSFNNEKKGFSARKEAAFGGFMLASWLSVKHTTAENLVSVITIWGIYSLLCLGIITLQQVIEVRNGAKTNTTDTPTTTP